MTAGSTTLALDHVIVGASDLDASVAFFEALGLALVDRRPVDAAAAAALHGLPTATQEVVLAVPGTAAAARLVATPLARIERDEFFRGGRAIDFYTTDIHASVAVAKGAGAQVGPIADYTFGPVRLTQALAVGPDELAVVFVGIDHRMPSVLDTEPDRLHSEVHSVVASVDDLAAETAFWTEVAGLDLRAQLPIDVPAVSELMLLPRHAPVTLSVMTGPAAAPPRFELMAYDDAEGRLAPSRPLTAGALVPVFVADGDSAAVDALVGSLVGAGASVGEQVAVGAGTAGKGTAGAATARWLRSPGGVDVELREVSRP